MKKNILFIYPGLWSFIACDKSILEEKYNVLPFHYVPSKSLTSNLKMQFKLLGWLLKQIWKADVLFLWFADYHTFLPTLLGKLFNKKTILLLAGYDVTYIPHIKYGAFSNPIRSFCAGYSIKNAKYVLPVDESLGRMAQDRVGKINGTMISIPFGLDATEWYCDTPKENFVLTVANVKDHQTYLRKGIDFYIEVAKQMPQYPFVLVGLNEGVAMGEIPVNFEVIKKLDRPMLQNYYSRAKVYAQFSIHEGLPNVLLEAMLCECIPVGTNVCGIPTGIGKSGHIINTVKEAKLAIEKSMATSSTGKNARQRVIDEFNLKQRENALWELIG